MHTPFGISRSISSSSFIGRVFAVLTVVLVSGCTNYHSAAVQVVLALEQDHRATTRTILYRENSDQIDPVSQPVLDGVIQYLKSNPAAHLEIFNTSNNTDGTAFDLPLSQKRAESAKTYIVSFGVDPSRVHSQALEQVIVSPK